MLLHVGRSLSKASNFSSLSANLASVLYLFEFINNELPLIAHLKGS